MPVSKYNRKAKKLGQVAYIVIYMPKQVVLKPRNLISLGTMYGDPLVI